MISNVYSSAVHLKAEQAATTHSIARCGLKLFRCVCYRVATEFSRILTLTRSGFRGTCHGHIRKEVIMPDLTERLLVICSNNQTRLSNEGFVQIQFFS
uniref:Uncharacterized protein n=1 Tax=Physcomitrium patens TaxID=3218 RepID=A0A2K1KGT5_PHYPA|nr:hypothetical protein PHYPA_009366 [Physcomitrium patens]